MSNAHRQAQRASARESAGGGGSNTGVEGASAGLFVCVDLAPKADEIRGELKSHTILKQAEKLAISEALLKDKDAIVSKLASLGLAERAESFKRLLPVEGNFKGDRKKVEYLVPFLVAAGEECLKPLLNNTIALQSLDARVRSTLGLLSVALSTARHNAATKKSNAFSNKFITLKGADKDRKFLEKGRLPQDDATRFCLGGCRHNIVDEPDSNEGVISRNAAKLRGREQQRAADQQSWGEGRTVTNSKGKELTKGRQRPLTLEVARQECHCEQCGCTSRNGDVPTDECPLKCIDESTGLRYEFDEFGNCKCPVCKCSCRMAWDITAHSIYNNESRIANNNGQVDTSLTTLAQTSATAAQSATSARTMRPGGPTNQQTFSQSSQRLGQIMAGAWHSAAKAGMNQAMEEHRRGGASAVRPLDMARMNDVAGHDSAVGISREFTRDSENAAYLRAMAGQMGQPTTMTRLRNGTSVNTRTIPSSSWSHREGNNDLRPVTASNDAGNKRKKHAQPKRNGPSKRLFPDSAGGNSGTAPGNGRAPAPPAAAGAPSATGFTAQFAAASARSTVPSVTFATSETASPQPKKKNDVIDLVSGKKSDEGGGKMSAEEKAAADAEEEQTRAAIEASLADQMNGYSPPGPDFGDLGNVPSSAFGGFSATPITFPVQSNPMGNLSFGDDFGLMDPQANEVVGLYNRMVARSTIEEGVIDVDNGTAGNEMARRRTANLMSHTMRAESFIGAQLHAANANANANASSSVLTSPMLVKKYDYYYKREYDSTP